MRPSLVPSLLAACAASLALASPALADSGFNGAGKCMSPKLEQPFAAFGDTAPYSMVPDGGLERGGHSWTLAGGAAVVDGNEPFVVHARNDSHALRLPPGSTGETDTFCVAQRHTGARLFATRTGGSPLDTLGVDAVVTTADGTVVEHHLADLTGGEWAPTDLVALASQLPELAGGAPVNVSLRFAPSGASAWTIDDVYVDPPVRCC